MGSDGNAGGDDSDRVPIPVGTTALLRSEGGTDPLAFVGAWGGRTNLLGVAVDRSIQLFLADWRSTVGPVPGDAALVGVGEATRSAADSASGSGTCGDCIRSVADPTDLDAVERHVRALLDRWRGGDRPTVVVVDSVTGLLDAAPEPDVNAFVADLADLLDGRNAVGFLTTRGSAERVPEPLERACGDVAAPSPAGWRPVEPDAVADVGVPLDDAFDLLANERRRRVLGHLHGRSRESVEGLAVAIAEGSDPGERTRLVGSLVHVHLPKLADAGVVEYDAETGVVEPTGAVEDLLSVVELVTGRE